MARGDLIHNLELPLTPDGQLDIAVFNRMFQLVQERVNALEGRSQPSQIRDDLSVLGGVSATGGVTGASLTLGGTTLTPSDLSLSPLLDPSVAPSEPTFLNALAARLPALGSSPFSVLVRDEFFGNGTTSGQIGDLGWSLSIGTVASGGQVLGHPGISVLSSGAGPAVSRIQLRAMDSGDLNYLAAVVQPGTDISACNLGFGVTFSNVAAGLEATQGIYWSYNAATSANWRTVTRDTAGITSNTSDIPVVASAWYLLEIVCDITPSAQVVDFYINRTRAFRHTTNISSADDAIPSWVVQTTDGNTKSGGIDTFILAGRVPLSIARWS
jgi:hypothetical protein